MQGKRRKDRIGDIETLEARQLLAAEAIGLGGFAQDSLRVSSVDASSGSIQIALSHPVSLGALNLYDGQDAAVDLADLVLIGPDGQPVAGSLVADGAAQNYFYWVKAKNIAGTSGFSSGDSGYQGPTAPGPAPAPLFLGIPSAAPPANDNFVNREVITGISARIAGTNVDATKEPGEPNHATLEGGKSVWWTWTAPTNGSVQIDTSGSRVGLDTILAVYTGTSVNALTHVASNDDGLPDSKSVVTLNVTVGTTYQIVVDGFQGQSAEIVLNLAHTTSDPPQASSSVAATDGTFFDKVRVTWAASTFATGYEVWRNTVDNSATATQISANTVGTTYDDTAAVAGTTYFYWVKAKNAFGTSGFSPSDAGIRAILRPSNDNFADRATMSGATATAMGTNENGTKEPGEPNHAGNAGGKSVWWTWTAPTSGFAQFDTFGSDFNTTLAVYTGAGVNGLTTVASNDDAGGGSTSSVTIPTVAGTAYQLAVDGRGGVSGNITLHVTPIATPLAPAGVAATDGAFRDRVRLTWSAAASAAGYEIWRNVRNDSATATKISSVDIVGTSYDDIGAATTNTLVFVPAGGPLRPGQYSLRLASRTDGFTSPDSQVGILDGDADGTAGGDYVATFSVGNSTARTLSVADFARGPRQRIALANSTGLPVNIDDATGVTQVEFAVDYDPAVMRVAGASLAPGLPADWHVDSVVVSVAGRTTVRASGTTALSPGARALVVLDAGTPDSALLGDAGQIRFSTVRLNNGALEARGDVATHAVGYPGDVNGSGTFSGLDASLIARVSVGLETGFDAFPAIDPVLLGDVTGNGRLSGLDASYVARKAIQLSQPEVPDVPGFPAKDDAFTASREGVKTGNLITDNNGFGVDDLAGGPGILVDFTAGGTIYLAGTTATLASGATLRVDADGGFSYDPRQSTVAGNQLFESFSYTLKTSTAWDGADVTISATDINDPPSFQLGGAQTANEDAGAQTVAAFATNISAGPANEAGQVLNFVVAVDRPDLFTSPPTIDATGTLRYTSAPDANGLATVSVRLRDDGGTDRGGRDTSDPQSFTITISPVNDAPVFEVGLTEVVDENSGGHTVAGFLTDLRSGPSNEAGQTWAFQVSTDHPEYFTQAPSIDPTGSLTYTLAANVTGTATVTVRMQDNGGTASGGQDTSAPQTFSIAIIRASTALYWDADGDSANNVIATGDGLGGSGMWTVGGGNLWFNPTTGQNVPWTDGARAVFVGGTGTVTVSGTVSAQKITASGGPFSLASGTINLPAIVGTPIDVASGASLTVGSVLAGTGPLIKAGGGTLIVSGNNTFSGGLTIKDGGDVQLANVGALKNAAPFNVVSFAQGSTGILRLNGNSITVAGLRTIDPTSTAVVENGGTTATTLSVNRASGLQSSFAGILRDGAGGQTLSLRTVGPGTLTLAGPNTYTGRTTIAGNGTLKLGANNAIPSGVPVDVGAFFGSNLSGGGTLDLNGFDNTVAGLNFGNQTNPHLVTTGIGTLTLAGNIAQDSAGTGSKFIRGNLSLGGGNRTINNSGATPLFIPAIVSDGGLTSNGNLVLSGASTFAGGLTIGGGVTQIAGEPVVVAGNLVSSPLGIGTLVLGNGGISSDGTTPRTIPNGVGFTTGGRTTTAVGDVTKNGKLTFTGGVNLASTNPHAIRLNSHAQFNGVMTGASPGYSVIGTGTLTITNTGNNFTGSFGVGSVFGIADANDAVGGTLLWGNSDVFPDGATILVGSGGTIDLAGNSDTVGGISFGVARGAGNPAIVNTGAGTLTLIGNINQDSAGTMVKQINGHLDLGGGVRTINNAGTTKLFIPAVITNGGWIVSSNLNLSGANTYAGGTTFTGGTTEIAIDPVGTVGAITSSALGTGTVTFNGGGVSSDGATPRAVPNAVSFTGNGILGNATNNGKLTFLAAANLGNAVRTVTVNSEAQFDGVVSGTGGITKAGPATLSLLADEVYTGVTNVNAGLLVLAGSNLAATGNITVTGGVARFDTINSINGGPHNVLNRDVTVTAPGAVMFGPAFGAANIPVALANRIVASSTGTIAADNYASENFDFNAAGLSAASLGAVGDIRYTGTLTHHASTYRLGGGGGTLTMANVNALLEPCSLIVSGPGLVVIAASNSLAGPTTINTGGTLQLGTGRTGENGSVASASVVDNGTLIFNTFENQTFAGVISGTGPLIKNGPGTLTLPATETYAGQTTVNDGRLILGGGDHSISALKPLVVNGGVLDLGPNDQYVGAFSGTGGSITGNGGTLTVTQASTSAVVFPGTFDGSLNLNVIRTGLNNSTGQFNLSLTGVSTTTGTITLLGGDHLNAQPSGFDRPVFNGIALKDGGRLTGVSQITLNNGTLYLNNSASTQAQNGGTAETSNQDLADRVNDAATILLNGGRIDFRGRAATNSTESLGPLTANTGIGSVAAFAGGTGTNSAVVTLASLTRAGGATLQVDGTNLGTAGNGNGRIFVTAPLTDNLAPVGAGVGIVPGVYRATPASSNLRPVGYVAGQGFVPVGTAGGPAAYSLTLAAAPSDANVVNPTTYAVLAGGQTINSLVQSGNVTFAADNDRLTIASGMLLQVNEVRLLGAPALRGELTSGLASGELFLIKDNGAGGGGGAAGDNKVHSVITDNGATRVRLVMNDFGRDNLVKNNFGLTANNTYTGGTVFSGGNTLYLQATTDGTTPIPLAADPARGLIIDNSTVTMQTFAQQIAAGNIVTLNGGSILNLFGANTLAGLVFNSNGGRGSAVPSVAGGTSLVITGNIVSNSTNPAVTPVISTPLALNGSAAHEITVAPLPQGTFINTLTPLNGLQISSVISDGGFTLKGAGVLNLTNAGSTYAGPLTIEEGTLNVAAVNNASANGPLGNSAASVLLGGSGGKTGTLEYTGITATSTKPFTIVSGGTGAFQVDSPATTLTLSGLIDGNGGLAKTGPGTLTLSGASNSYAGATLVSAGTLNVNGSLTTSPVMVAGGTLAGNNGTIGGTVAVTAAGTLSPGGAAAGVLSTGGLSLAAGAKYVVQVNGDTAGTQYDRTNVTGSVALGGANLVLSGTRANLDGRAIVIVQNDGADAVTGTFSGLAEGASVSVNGVSYTVTYNYNAEAGQAGTGNDVALIDNPGPAPLVAMPPEFELSSAAPASGKSTDSEAGSLESRNVPPASRVSRAQVTEEIFATVDAASRTRSTSGWSDGESDDLLGEADFSGDFSLVDAIFASSDLDASRWRH